MPAVIIETEIKAAPGVCFDLIRQASFAQAIEKNSAGKAIEKIRLGETVTFETKQFGIRQKLTVEVTEFEKSSRFVDEMIEGGFKRFRHIHEFVPTARGTLLRDTLVWTSPLGFVGRIFDALLIKKLLRKTVLLRNEKLKKMAEKSTGF